MPSRMPTVTPPTPVPSRPGLDDQDDADLLVYMALAEEDPDLARAAWGAFYTRHARYLHAVCLRAFGPLLGGEAGAADLVAETFRKVYRSADRFEVRSGRDADALRLQVRAWLGRIAQRLAQDALRRRSRLAETHLEPGLWQQTPGPTPTPAGNEAMIDRVRSIVEQLPERQQIVLRATLQWYRPDADHQRMPADAVADLARTLNTTPENLRQLRRRALQRVETELREAGLAPTDRKAVQ